MTKTIRDMVRSHSLDAMVSDTVLGIRSPSFIAESLLGLSPERCTPGLYEASLAERAACLSGVNSLKAIAGRDSLFDSMSLPLCMAGMAPSAAALALRDLPEAMRLPPGAASAVRDYTRELRFHDEATRFGGLASTVLGDRFGGAYAAGSCITRQDRELELLMRAEMSRDREFERLRAELGASSYAYAIDDPMTRARQQLAAAGYVWGEAVEEPSIRRQAASAAPPAQAAGAVEGAETSQPPEEVEAPIVEKAPSVAEGAHVSRRTELALRLLLGRRDYEVILGDLTEHWASDNAEFGHRSANLIYWREAIASAWPILGRRLVRIATAAYRILRALM
jgi:hypothetical protein